MTRATLRQRSRWSVLAGEEEVAFDDAGDLALVVERMVAEKFSELRNQFKGDHDRALKDIELLTTRAVPLDTSSASSGQEALAPSGNAAAAGGVRQHEGVVTEDRVHELIDEAWGEQFSQMVQVFRDGPQNLVTRRHAAIVEGAGQQGCGRFGGESVLLGGRCRGAEGGPSAQN